ncbi:MAG: amidohydrolase family protein [Desulfovibrio sp.]|nr:amidohydrolase family protein [Desulfovibrio sp.]
MSDKSAHFRSFRKIDAHSHIGFFGDPFHVNFTVDALIEQMDTYAIEKTILCSAGCTLNDEVENARRKFPSRIVPLCWVNANLGQAAYDMLEHCLRDQHFAGVKMQPLFDAFVADSEVVDPIIDIAEEYSCPVFIHSGHPPFSLPWQIGLLAERHPNVPIVMVHMGHGHGVYIDAAIKMAKKFDNLFLETSGMPMGCQIKNAYLRVGSERIMFGIDSPFHHPTVEIQRVLSCGLDDVQLEDVLYNNAAKFMGWK